MTDVELNTILYLADYLSLQQKSIPVSETCKYFFIKGAPINIQYLQYKKIDVPLQNEYVKQALELCIMISHQFDEDGERDFIDHICEIQASGMVDAERMLQYIYQYDSKGKNKALDIYYNYINNKKYIIEEEDEDGNITERECTKYIKHYEDNKEYDFEIGCK